MLLGGLRLSKKAIIRSFVGPTAIIEGDFNRRVLEVKYFMFMEFFS